MLVVPDCVRVSELADAFRISERIELPAGARLYRWHDGGANPYHALLGLADRFVVTGDSVSMMVEVARLGKPLAIFALPEERRLLRWRGTLGGLRRWATAGRAPRGAGALGVTRAQPCARRATRGRGGTRHCPTSGRRRLTP